MTIHYRSVRAEQLQGPQPNKRTPILSPCLYLYLAHPFPTKTYTIASLFLEACMISPSKIAKLKMPSLSQAAALLLRWFRTFLLHRLDLGVQ